MKSWKRAAKEPGGGGWLTPYLVRETPSISSLRDKNHGISVRGPGKPQAAQKRESSLPGIVPFKIEVPLLCKTDERVVSLLLLLNLLRQSVTHLRVTKSPPFRAARSAASLTTLASSAPENPDVKRGGNCNGAPWIRKHSSSAAATLGNRQCMTGTMLPGHTCGEPGGHSNGLVLVHCLVQRNPSQMDAKDLSPPGFVGYRHNNLQQGSTQQINEASDESDEATGVGEK